MKYTDLVSNIKIQWARTGIKVNLDDDKQRDNWFRSDLADSLFNARSQQFTAKQFLFHTPSEHTINGKYYDLEMQIVHAVNASNTTIP